MVRAALLKGARALQPFDGEIRLEALEISVASDEGSAELHGEGSGVAVRKRNRVASFQSRRLNAEFEVSGKVAKWQVREAVLNLRQSASPPTPFNFVEDLRDTNDAHKQLEIAISTPREQFCDALSTGFVLVKRHQCEGIENIARTTWRFVQFAPPIPGTSVRRSRLPIADLPGVLPSTKVPHP